jgi:hypothetical protein
MVQLSGGKTVASAALAAIAAATWTSASYADTAPAPSAAVTFPGSAPVVEETTYVPPNRAILAGGLIAFAGSYVPSVVVAAANGNSFDNRLYIPIAGPWIDLGQRPGCAGSQFNCSRESGFAGLLIVDGVVQALGALATGLAFVVPERRTRVLSASADRARRSAPQKLAVHVVPARLGQDGYGVAAFGGF